MHRRDFLAAPLLVANPLKTFAATAAQSTARALMKVGTQHGDSDANRRSRITCGPRPLASTSVAR